MGEDDIEGEVVLPSVDFNFFLKKKTKSLGRNTISGNVKMKSSLGMPVLTNTMIRSEKNVLLSPPLKQISR